MFVNIVLVQLSHKSYINYIRLAMCDYQLDLESVNKRI